MKMNLSSTEFKNKEFIPIKYTCDGQDINPPLEISGVPEKAESLALIVDDPDAPNGDWVHWVLWNIPPDTLKIKESSVPQGAIEGTNDFNHTRYGGPCPPKGTHHYYFKLYALDTVLDLDSSKTKKDLLKAVEGHIIAQAELVGLYQR